MFACNWINEFLVVTTEAYVHVTECLNEPKTKEINCIDLIVSCFFAQQISILKSHREMSLSTEQSPKSTPSLRLLSICLLPIP